MNPLKRFLADRDDGEKTPIGHDKGKGFIDPFGDMDDDEDTEKAPEATPAPVNPKRRARVNRKRRKSYQNETFVTAATGLDKGKGVINPGHLEQTPPGNFKPTPPFGSMFSMREKSSGFRIPAGSSLFDMGKGRRLLSAFPREIWKMLNNPTVTKFLLKYEMLHIMQQSLLTLVAVADDLEVNLFPSARSASSNVLEWICHFQDTMFRLDEVLTDISSEATAYADAEHAVDFILRRFETLTKQKHLLFRTEKQGKQGHRSSRNPTVYGRDREKNEMIDYLMSDDRASGNTSVIAIVGVDGVGKTTFADLVYDDDRVKPFFELRGWVEFQEKLDVVSLARMILDVLNEDFHYDDSLTELMLRLRKCLQGKKKLLLVLDGFRNVAGWENLRTCFDDAAGRGSAVILTTQKVEVALEMLSDRVLHLGLLSLEDSCSLFSEHAFGDEDEDPCPELASLRKQIVRKIGGLPLAAKKLGSLLYDHQSIHTWKKLLKIKRSELLDLDLDLDIIPLQFPASSCLYHFGNLVRLEVIGARKSNLPDGIGELRCLEYLDLSFSCICTLPDSISSLSRLQTLRLSFCHNLGELPNTLVDLVNLRYLDIRGTAQLRQMPLGLGRLENLQTLIGFTVSTNNRSNLTELEKISSIQTLSITMLQNTMTGSFAYSLRDKRFLENLTLKWNQLRVSELHVPKRKRPAKYVEPSERPTILELLSVIGCEVELDSLKPPRQLKMLEIFGCPIGRFPHWLGNASFGTLEVLNLRDCRNCCFLPPLGQLPSLKDLSIQGFNSVRSLGNEFYGKTTSCVPFKSLEILWFVDMPNWKEWILLDAENLQFPNLRELYLIQCPELLQDLPKHLPSLEKLEISECDRLVASPPKIPDKYELMVQEQDCNEILVASVAEVTSESSSQHAPASKGGGTILMPPIDNSKFDEVIPSFEILKIANASELSKLHDLPKNLKSLKIEGCQFLESLPDNFLIDCSDILELSFINCCSLRHFADVLRPDSLRTLYIHKCPTLEFLIPIGTHNKFAFLKHLYIISSCKSLTFFSINLFPQLQTLYIKDCPNLQSFSIAVGLRDQNLKLESLEILDCPRLLYFPESGLSTPNLRSISMSNCKSLKSLPNHLETLTSLQSLLVHKCPQLESSPDRGLPSSLSLLSIVFSDKLAPQREWKLHTFHSLSHFEIEGGCVGMKSFPDKGLLPRNLKSLRISRLSSLRVLNGMGLRHLIALEKLEIICCRGLFSLPGEGLPSSLIYLCIKECSILTQKLLYKAGTEWNKIAHIPSIQIDDFEVHGVEERRGTPGQKRQFRVRKS